MGSIRSLGFNFTDWFAPFFSVRILTRKVACGLDRMQNSAPSSIAVVRHFESSFASFAAQPCALEISEDSGEINPPSKVSWMVSAFSGVDVDRQES